MNQDNPTLQTVNQDGSAILVNTQSLTLTVDDVAQHVSSLQKQIQTIQSDTAVQIAGLQSKLDFYQSIQVQQAAVLGKNQATDPIQATQEQTSLK